MAEPDAFAGEPQSLMQLMDLDLLGTAHWRPEELGAILAHQLGAPLAGDLGCYVADLDRTLAAAGIRTFGQLLFHPQPPVELLEAVKCFAKASRADPDSPLPDEVATVLYFAAIAAALLRRGQRITQMGDEALRYGLAWVGRQAWLDAQSRALFDEASAALGRPNAG